MKVERFVEIETNDIHVDDRIHVGKYTATCQNVTSNAALFLLDQYITGHGYLREALQSEEVLNDFADIRDQMVPFEDGDLLKIPYGCGWNNSEISRFRPIFLISLKKEDTTKKSGTQKYEWIPFFSSKGDKIMRWIPCTERLPEKSGRYLVTRKFSSLFGSLDDVFIVNYSEMIGVCVETKIWWIGNPGTPGFEELDDVIAWMPLPDPR